MNWTEHILEEIVSRGRILAPQKGLGVSDGEEDELTSCIFLAQELHAFQVSEAVACLLHTILFVRAPGPLRPRETFCDSLNLSYSRCGVRDVDQKVEEAVEGLWHSLTPAGPDLLKGCVTLRFFERRIKRSMFGLMR
jgi:hypothetical protein